MEANTENEKKYSNRVLKIANLLFDMWTKWDESKSAIELLPIIKEHKLSTKVRNELVDCGIIEIVNSRPVMAAFLKSSDREESYVLAAEILAYRDTGVKEEVVDNDVNNIEIKDLIGVGVQVGVLKALTEMENNPALSTKVCELEKSLTPLLEKVSLVIASQVTKSE